MPIAITIAEENVAEECRDLVGIVRRDRMVTATSQPLVMEAGELTDLKIRSQEDVLDSAAGEFGPIERAREQAHSAVVAGAHPRLPWSRSIGETCFGSR